jgi:hypothetical protein
MEKRSRDVDDEGSMWEITLQDLKGSSVSGVASRELKGSMGGDVESNKINLKENNDVHINAHMLQRAICVAYSNIQHQYGESGEFYTGGKRTSESA